MTMIQRAVILAAILTMAFLGAVVVMTTAHAAVMG